MLFAENQTPSTVQYSTVLNMEILYFIVLDPEDHFQALKLLKGNLLN